MGLDAIVYCDCFESGRLRSTPPPEYDLYISDEGAIECRNKDLDTQIAFDAWRYNQACAHEDAILMHHRIGNIALVGLLRAELSKCPDWFPIILSKIIYNGTHCGDRLKLEDVRLLQNEIKDLKDFQCRDTESQEIVNRFHAQLAELIDCALSVQKPIVF